MPETITSDLAAHITFGAAQRQLGVSTHYLRGLIDAGKIRAYRLSKRVVLLRVDDVRSVLAAGRIKPSLESVPA